MVNIIYGQTYDISHTLEGNKTVDHWDAVGASPVGAAAAAFYILTPGFNGLGKDSCKTKRETYKFWDLVRLVSDFYR